MKVNESFLPKSFENNVRPAGASSRYFSDARSGKGAAFKNQSKE